MENRLTALEKKYAVAMLKIDRLEQIINELTGNRENGPITMRQAREAFERGDKLTVARFNEQEEKRYLEQKAREASQTPPK